jgi:hypothetical protein
MNLRRHLLASAAPFCAAAAPIPATVSSQLFRPQPGSLMVATIGGRSIVFDPFMFREGLVSLPGSKHSMSWIAP